MLFQILLQLVGSWLLQLMYYEHLPLIILLIYISIGALFFLSFRLSVLLSSFTPVFIIATLNLKLC